MPLIIPNNYHITASLRDRGITCIEKQSIKAHDKHTLRIGIFNVMPEAEKYEFSIMRPLGLSAIPVIPVWIRAANHNYKSSNKDHIKKWYLTFKEATKNEPLDGLIITGAPVETIPFKAVSYWEELTEIFNYARTNIASTLGICWGGLALAKMFGVEKINYAKKLFGVYASRNLNRHHRITGGFNDIFYCPQSRYAGFNENDLNIAADSGKINLLAHSEETGHFIFESSDERFIGHLGHHEYDAERIIFEHFRDLQKGLENAPVNFDVNNPVNVWRENGNEFFSRWIQNIYTKRYGKQ